MTRFILLIFLSVMTLSCNQQQQHSRVTIGTSELKDPAIRTAIEEMMQKEGPYTFVIFEEPNSGKFVQFAGNKKEELMFDLPSDQMSPPQLEKAKKILAGYGIYHETSPTYSDETETKVVGEMNLFSKRLNNDIDLAVELTSRIMIDVYGFDENTQLKIETE